MLNKTPSNIPNIVDELEYCPDSWIVLYPSANTIQLIKYINKNNSLTFILERGKLSYPKIFFNETKLNFSDNTLINLRKLAYKIVVLKETDRTQVLVDLMEVFHG